MQSLHHTCCKLFILLETGKMSLWCMPLLDLINMHCLVVVTTFYVCVCVSVPVLCFGPTVRGDNMFT